MESMKEALKAMLEEIPDDNEIVVMDEGQEEVIAEMIEGLMNGEPLLEENNDIEIIPIEDEEDGSNNVMVQENYHFASLGNKYWWEAYALASEGENYVEYNWCFEDDLKIWEWSEYFKMQGLIEPKAGGMSAN